jgi:hypothetical protein
MPDLPDPKSPLTKGEAAVYGVDTCRHKITGFPISRAGEDRGPVLSPNEQAYRAHLPLIFREHGRAVYEEYKRRLDEFVRNGGEVELPPRAWSVPMKERKSR